MRLILKLLREGSGRILIFLDWMIKPAIVKRSSENQLQVNKKQSHLSFMNFMHVLFVLKLEEPLND